MRRFIVFAYNAGEEDLMSGLQRSQSITADLDIHPLAGRIGAHIDNIHLARDLPDAVTEGGGSAFCRQG